jgi:metallo-beta-lactamase class B
MKHLFLSALTGLALLCAQIGGLVSAQPIPGIESDTQQMYVHMKRAREIAGADLHAHYVHRCIMDQTYRRTISRGLQASNKIEATKVFDNLYFVGENDVSAWALTTNAGIVLFDSLNSPEEVKNVIEPGLRKFGLDPRNIKYVVITHAHGDHFGGANYLRAAYGAQLLASKIDWKVMADMGAPTAAKDSGYPASWAALVPTHGLDIEDGQTMTVGDTTLRFYITPGHTPGTVSTVFRTTDNGEPHVVGFFGGMGTPASAADKKALIESAKRFEVVATEARIDVLLANHVTQDQAIPKLEELRLRRPGDPNPYVIGVEQYRRYLQVQQECTMFAMAQQGQK